MYPHFLPKYNLRIAIPCDYTAAIYGQNTSGLDYEVTVIIDLENGTPPTDLKGHLALTESHIPENWGMLSEVNFVCRAMYPDHNGTLIDFAGGSQVTLTYNFTLDASWVQSNIELVFFLQTDATWEILQGTMVPIDNLAPPWADANFSANDTTPCATSPVQFADESLGQILTWNWSFEGGDPATSTEQNPIVTYATPGEYDVELTVDDGSVVSTMTKTEYISAISTPPIAGTPDGPLELCGGETGITYTTSGATWAEDYTWEINPSSAGTIMGTSTVATLDLDPAYGGPIDITVRGNNDCGDGVFSDALAVEVFPLPEVYWISDGSSFCEGGDGVEVTLDGSESGVDYELLLDGVATGEIVAGTGSAISFGYQQGPGIYTIEAFTAYCSSIMFGTAYIYPVGAPGQATAPTGDIATCIGGTNDYTTDGAPDADSYVWTLTPPEAGEISGTGVDATVVWSDSYTGTASISVQGINDCGDGVVSDALDVDVQALPEPVVSGEEYVYEYTDHSYSTTEHAGATYDWTVTGGTIESGQGTYEIMVSWGGPGQGTINLTETSDAGCIGDASELIVNISPVSIGESFMNELKLYPNPARETLNIELYSDRSASIQVQVVNQTGQIMMDISKDITNGNNKTTLNTSDLPGGYYTLKMIAEDGSVVNKGFVIIK